MMKSFVSNIKKFPSLLIGAVLGSLLSLSSAYADEAFTQDGKQYVIKEGVIGIMKKPTTDFGHDGSQKNQLFFDMYDSAKLRAHGGVLNNKQKYRVVYRLEKNTHTNKVKEIPGLLTNNIIVEAKNTNQGALETNLKLKKSYQENGFYVYELPADQSVSDVLTELAKNSAILKARVEVIEHLRVPM